MTDWWWWASPARPFDGAQGERPFPGDGLTPEAHLRSVSGHGKDGGRVTLTLLGESSTLARSRLGASATRRGGGVPTPLILRRGSARAAPPGTGFRLGRRDYGGRVTLTLLGESSTLARSRLGASATRRGGGASPPRSYFDGAQHERPHPALDSGSGGGITEEGSPSLSSASLRP